MPVKCKEHVGAGVVSYPCSLPAEHDGPCMAVEKPASVAARKRWEAGQGARDTLSETQSPPQTFAQANAAHHNATPVPGSKLQPAEYRQANQPNVGRPGAQPITTTCPPHPLAAIVEDDDGSRVCMNCSKMLTEVSQPANPYFGEQGEHPTTSSVSTGSKSVPEMKHHGVCVDSACPDCHPSPVPDRGLIVAALDGDPEAMERIERDYPEFMTRVDVPDDDPEYRLAPEHKLQPENIRVEGGGGQGPPDRASHIFPIVDLSESPTDVLDLSVREFMVQRSEARAHLQEGFAMLVKLLVELDRVNLIEGFDEHFQPVLEWLT